MDIDPEADNKGRDFGLYSCKLLLCLLYRQYDRAVKNADRVLQVLEGATSLGSSVPTFYCWNALARLGAYPGAAPDEKKMILKQVETSREKLRLLAQQSPVNYRHKYDLVNAERHRVLGRDSEAMALFDRVIQEARESEYLYDVALANEMTARFYLDKNRISIARSYMTEARYAYLRWGAAAKVQDLEENYPELLLDVMASKQAGFLAGLTEVTTTSSDAAEALDLASVLKSTQAMSGEIVLAKLLEKLLNLTMENAGAQRGILVLESDGQLFVEAEMSLDSQDTTVRQSTPLDSSTAFSKVHCELCCPHRRAGRAGQCGQSRQVHQHALYSKSAAKINFVHALNDERQTGRRFIPGKQSGGGRIYLRASGGAESAQQPGCHFP